jgi:hypothetical protein
MRPRAQVLFATDAAVVLMDGPAAGSRGVGPVFHGRIGDGATLTLDVAPAVVRRGGAASNKVYKAFHSKNTKNIGRTERREVQAATGRAGRGKKRVHGATAGVKEG